jgi:uncharacterized protein YxjI
MGRRRRVERREDRQFGTRRGGGARYQMRQKMVAIGEDFWIEIEQGQRVFKVAEVSKKWFRLRDTYGLAIDPGQNDVHILAVTVAIDMMAHQGRQQNSPRYR